MSSGNFDHIWVPVATLTFLICICHWLERASLWRAGRGHLCRQNSERFMLGRVFKSHGLHNQILSRHSEPSRGQVWLHSGRLHRGPDHKRVQEQREHVRSLCQQLQEPQQVWQQEGQLFAHWVPVCSL